jgi:hypothetical protein
VPGQAARDDEQRVDPDRVAFAGEAGRKALGGIGDAAQAIFVERPGGGFLAAALLDLDEGQRSSATGDQVDLAARNPRAPRQDPPPAQPQPPGGDRFGPPAPRLGEPPAQSLPPSWSASE